MNDSTFFDTYGYYYEDLVNTMKLFRIADKVQFYILIVICVVGLIGNPVSVAVYLSKEFHKNTLGTYFAAHSLIDILYMFALLISQLQQFLFPQYILFCHKAIFKKRKA